ncbi:MAG: hypothetical protein KDE08_10510 [Rhodobacteraceae bacterium]|nr:hypothetical protein [Paracoccaceae bacterium]
MGKLLAAGAVLLGLYALYDSQKPGSRLRMTGSTVTAPSFGNSPTGGGIGAATAGVAAKVSN